MNFKLGTASWNGEYHPVALVGENLYDLADIVGYAGRSALLRVFREWDTSFERIANFVSSVDGRDPIDPALNVRLQTPLIFPSKVICAAANYYDHLEEMKVKNVSRETISPYFFFKPPTTTLVGPGKTIRMPVGSDAYDWEVELAAIIGRPAKGVSIENALDVVAGYAVSIDLTARDLQLDGGDLFAMDWYAGKAQDTTCPIGPFITPSAFIPDPQDVDIALSVNGKTRQQANTAGMIYSTAELISAASRFVTLEPGDIILTGSPAGVGHVNRDYLKLGDNVVASSPELGELALEVCA